MTRLSSHYYPAFLKQLMYQEQMPELGDGKAMTAWLSTIETRLNEGLPTVTSYSLSVLKDDEGVERINVIFNRHGISTDYHIPG